MLRLFHESIACRSCGHQWTGYLHGFSRGHGVLVRDSTIAFVPDDLLYAFAEQIRKLPDDPHLQLSDPSDCLRSEGWRDLESCPRCGAVDFEAKFDQLSMTLVPCIAFDANDFQLCDRMWVLTAAGRAKMDGK